jgi:hypothetical protein
VPVDEIQAALSITEEELSAVSMLLYNQQLLATRGQVGCIGLNTSGQFEAERLGPLVAMRDLPREHPSAVIVGSASNSIIQVAGSQSNQNATLSVQQSQILELLNQIERTLPSLALPPEKQREAADVLTALRDGTKRVVSSAANKVLATALDAMLRPAASELGQRLLHLVAGSA